MVLRVASLYFILLSFGCLAPLPLVKLKEIGVGFYRFFAMTCLVLGGVGWALFRWAGNPIDPSLYSMALPAYLAALLTFYFLLRSKRPDLIRVSFWAAVLLGLLSVVLPWVRPYLPPQLGDVSKLPIKVIACPPLVQMVHVLASSLVMGFATLAMMLGHWYLVTPRLSITPLKRFAGGYILLTLFTALELALVYLAFIGLFWGKPASFLGDLLEREFIFALFRVTWGVLAPLGFAYWIWETVKMRSTQSATGILYAAMVCTLMGEGIGLYLTLQTGVPF